MRKNFLDISYIVLEYQYFIWNTIDPYLVHNLKVILSSKNASRDHLLLITQHTSLLNT